MKTQEDLRNHSKQVTIFFILLTAPLVGCGIIKTTKVGSETRPDRKSEILLKQKKHHDIGESEEVSVNPTLMISAHNKWRFQVGVPGLTWSDELAASSWQWAAQLAQGGCNMRHSKTVHGENIYFAGAAYKSDGTSSTQKVSEQDVVDAWGNEVSNYDYESNSCHGVCGHYTQMVWQSTIEVGCGMALCNDKAQIWVCQYSPRGNIVGQRPYSRKNEYSVKMALF